MGIINWNERKLAKALIKVKSEGCKTSLDKAKHILKTCGGLDLGYVAYHTEPRSALEAPNPVHIYELCSLAIDKELFGLANSYHYTGKGAAAKDLKFWESDEKKIYKALEKNDLTGVERILSNLKKSELDFTAKVGSEVKLAMGTDSYTVPIKLIDKILSHDKISSILSLFDKYNIEFDNVNMSCKKLEVEPLGKVKSDIIKPAEYSITKGKEYGLVTNLIDRRIKNKENALNSLYDVVNIEGFLGASILFDNKKLFGYLTDMMGRSVRPKLNGNYLKPSLIIAINENNRYMISKLVNIGGGLEESIERLRHVGNLDEALALKYMSDSLENISKPLYTSKEKAKIKPEVKPEPVSKYIKESDHIVSISEKLEDTGETLTTKFNFKSDTARYVVNNKTLGILSFKDYTDEQTIIEASKFLQDNGGDITDWSARNSKKTAVSKVLIVDLKNKGCN